MLHFGSKKAKNNILILVRAFMTDFIYSGDANGTTIWFLPSLLNNFTQFFSISNNDEFFETMSSLIKYAFFTVTVNIIFVIEDFLTAQILTRLIITISIVTASIYKTDSTIS